MSEGFIRDIVLGILALLGTVSTGASVVLASRFGALKRDVAAVKHEVKNDHSTNMRVEQDERHSENSDALRSIRDRVEQVFDTVSWLVPTAVSNSDRIGDLEDTAGVARSRRALRLERERPRTITADAIPRRSQ